MGAQLQVARRGLIGLVKQTLRLARCRMAYLGVVCAIAAETRACSSAIFSHTPALVVAGRQLLQLGNKKWVVGHTPQQEALLNY